MHSDFSFTDDFQFVNGVPAFVLEPHTAPAPSRDEADLPLFKCCAFSHSGARFVAGDDQGHVYVWDTKGFKLIRYRTLESGTSVGCVSFFEKSEVEIVACDVLGGIQCFSLEDEEILSQNNFALQEIRDRCFIKDIDLALKVAMDAHIASSQIWPPQLYAYGTTIVQAISTRQSPDSFISNVTLFLTKFTSRGSTQSTTVISKKRNLVSRYSMTEDGTGLIVCFSEPLPHEQAFWGDNIRDNLVEVWPQIVYEEDQPMHSVELSCRLARWELGGKLLIGWKNGDASISEARVEVWERSSFDANHRNRAPLITCVMEQDDTIFHLELLQPTQDNAEDSIVLAVCFTESNEAHLIVNIWDAELNAVIKQFSTSTAYRDTLVGRRQYLNEPGVMSYHWGHNRWVMEESLFKMCVSPDKQWMAFYSSECNRGYLWSIKDGVPVAKLDLPAHLNDEDLSAVTSTKKVEFDPSGSKILIIGAHSLIALVPAFLQKENGPQMRFIDTPKEKSMSLDFLKLSHNGSTLALGGSLKENNVSNISKRVGPGILNVMHRKEVQAPEGIALIDSSRVAKDVALSKTGSLVGFLFTDNFVALASTTSAVWDSSVQFCRFPNDRVLKVISSSTDQIYNRLFFSSLKNGQEQLVCFSLQQKGAIVWLDIHTHHQIGRLPLSVDRALGLRLSENRSHAVILSTQLVQIVDLEERCVVKNIGYLLSIPRARHLLFARASDDAEIFFRESDQYEVSEDGSMVLIGWDTLRKCPLYLTPETRSSQYRRYVQKVMGGLNSHVQLSSHSRFVFVSNEKKMDSNTSKGIGIYDTQNKLPPRMLPDELDQTGSRPLFDVSEDARIIVARSVFPRSADESLLSDTIMVMSPYAIEGNIPDFQKLVLTRKTESEDTIHQLIAQFGWPLLNSLDSENRSLFQQALEAGKQGWIDALHQLSKDEGIPISLFWKEGERENGTPVYKNALQWALQWASETRSDQVVWAQITALIDKVTTVEATAKIFKNAVTELFIYFPEFFIKLLEENLLIADYGEAPVALNILESSQNRFLVGSNHNALSWEIQSAEKVRRLWKGMGISIEAPIVNGRKRADIPAESKFVLLEDCAQIGMRGIIRRLLLLNVPVRLFETEVVQWIVAHKWRVYGFKRCANDLFSYICLVVAYTFYAVRVGWSGENLEHNWKESCLLIIPLALAVLLAVLNCLQEYRQVCRLYRDAEREFKRPMVGIRYYTRSQWNWIELVSYFILIVCIPYLHIRASAAHGANQALTVAVSVDALLLWWKLLYFAQAFEVSGPLVVMIRQIVIDIKVFIFLSLMILTGFSIAFFVLYRHDEDNESFQDLSYSFTSMFIAILGDFDFSEFRGAQHLAWLATLLFIFYTLAMVVVLLNLVIAIMSDSYDKVKSQETANFLKCRAMVIDDSEATMSFEEIKQTEKKIARYLHVLQPVLSSDFRDEWQGKIGALENVVKGHIDESQKAIYDKLHILQDAMERLSQHLQDQINTP